MRLMTRWVLRPSRSSSGFRLMNMRPWLTEGFQPEAPTEEPTLATAGSASTMSRAWFCSLVMAPNEMSVAATVEAMTRPVSSCGKFPFGVLM
jgi:hypothetical protein